MRRAATAGATRVTTAAMRYGSRRSTRATKPPRSVAKGNSPHVNERMMPSTRPKISPGTMVWRSAPHGTFQIETAKAMPA